MTQHEDTMEKIVSLAKRRGFIYQGSEVYGGLAGTWDYGPLGVALKNNLKALWWKKFVDTRPDMYGVDAAILMNPRVWEASEHVTGFHDPLVECTKCKKRFRADHLEDTKNCPECKGELGAERQFNMMFKTHIGATEDASSVSYLRPETAGGMFVNFKNIVDSFHPKLPFGLAQIGKAFRNEIAPRDFLFRVREFEQMEIEYFVRENEWEKHFDAWRASMWEWIEEIGLSKEHVHELEVSDEDRAHYSKRTIDFEYDYPFGRKELYGLAYRTDFDLSSHMKHSGADLRYFDQEANERFIPHVIEPSLGVERTILAILLESYKEEEVNGEKRVVLALPYALAPMKVAVLPLMRKELLKDKALEVFQTLSPHFVCLYDETQSIGKRYRRQDEIGTPYCVTIDFDTLEDNAVTVRDRNTMEQERISLDELQAFLDKKLRTL